jgi:tagatose 1,6-diphosphate aldolase
MELTPGKWWGLRRLADANGRFKMAAMDQRPPIKNLIAARNGVEVAPYADVCDVKALLVDTLGRESSAVLLDPHYAYPAAIQLVSPSSGLILTLEDSVFADDPDGRRSAAIDHWSVAKIKGAGADAVKVLAWYRPDASAAAKAHQQEFVATIGNECRRYDIPFVFELLVYPLPGDAHQTTDYVEQPGKRAEHVLESVETFAAPEYGVDLFKLESPVAGTDVPDQGDANAHEVQKMFDALGRAAGRPWVMLSAGVTQDAFTRILRMAYSAGASGYLAGRAIWWDAFQQFPDLGAMRADLETGAVGYMRVINHLTDEAATPWHDHPVFGPEGPKLRSAGPTFRVHYQGIAAR